MLERVETKGKINMEVDDLLNNIRSSIRRHLPQVRPYEVQSQELIFACGGPSLEIHLDELKKQHEEGIRIVSVNNVHEYLQDHGIKPSIQIMIDGRDFNARFVSRPIKECRYLLASQCPPKVFDALENFTCTIFHCGLDDPRLKEILDNYYMGRYYPIDGGVTVGIRGLQLLFMLGFRYFHVYGLDSCLMDKKHHSYSQPENDNPKAYPIWIENDESKEPFLCYPWMVRQAEDFIALAAFMGRQDQQLKLNIVGDGLIAAIVKLGATRLKETE